MVGTMPFCFICCYGFMLVESFLCELYGMIWNLSSTPTIVVKINVSDAISSSLRIIAAAWSLRALSMF